MEQDTGRTSDTDWLFSTWASDSSDRYGYFCADDADFHDCLCHDMYAIAAGVVSFIPGFAGAVYLSLLYTGKWSAENVHTIWRNKKENIKNI